jgi:hypothetical protein
MPDAPTSYRTNWGFFVHFMDKCRWNLRAGAALAVKSDQALDELTELAEAINRSLAAATQPRKATRAHRPRALTRKSLK